MFRKMALHTVVLMTVAAATLAACGTDSSEEPGRTPQPTPEATPTTVAPTPPGTSEPTGIAAIDEVIAAVESGDVDALIELILFEPEECAPPAMGAGGPPQCEDGEATGTEVDVVPLASCEGYWSREDGLRQALAPLFEGDPNIFGVYRAQERLFDRAGDYAVIFEVDSPNGKLARNVVMTDEGVAGVNLGCGDTPEQMVERHGLTDVVYEAGTPGGEEPQARCAEGADEALCGVADALAKAASAKDAAAFAALVDRGRAEAVECKGDGEPFDAEQLCAGAAAGEVRNGFQLAVHGSEGSVIAPTVMKDTLSKHASAGMSVASTACTADCAEFIVAFKTASGAEPRAVYVAFAVLDGGPAFIGAGVSGDNADSILSGGRTSTVAGEATFSAWSS